MKMNYVSLLSVMLTGIVGVLSPANGQEVKWKTKVDNYDIVKWSYEMPVSVTPVLMPGTPSTGDTYYSADKMFELTPIMSRNNFLSLEETTRSEYLRTTTCKGVPKDILNASNHINYTCQSFPNSIVVRELFSDGDKKIRSCASVLNIAPDKTDKSRLYAYIGICGPGSADDRIADIAMHIHNTMKLIYVGPCRINMGGCRQR